MEIRQNVENEKRVFAEFRFKESFPYILGQNFDIFGWKNAVQKISSHFDPPKIFYFIILKVIRSGSRSIRKSRRCHWFENTNSMLIRVHILCWRLLLVNRIEIKLSPLCIEVSYDSWKESKSVATRNFDFLATNPSGIAGE